MVQVRLASAQCMLALSPAQVQAILMTVYAFTYAAISRTAGVAGATGIAGGAGLRARNGMISLCTLRNFR
jgi:hypothetical protein